MILKEIKDSDIHKIYEGLSDPEVTKFYDVHFSTLEETEEQMAWYRQLKENETGKWWGIYNNQENFCGTGGFYDWDKANKKAEFGIWLLKPFWGQGIMNKALPIFFDKGFNEMDLNRIEAYVYHNNEKCKKALEKSYFKYEGTMKEYEMKDDIPIDMDIFAVLKSDIKNKYDF